GEAHYAAAQYGEALTSWRHLIDANSHLKLSHDFGRRGIWTRVLIACARAGNWEEFGLYVNELYQTNRLHDAVFDHLLTSLGPQGPYPAMRDGVPSRVRNRYMEDFQRVLEKRLGEEAWSHLDPDKQRKAALRTLWQTFLNETAEIQPGKIDT